MRKTSGPQFVQTEFYWLLKQQTFQDYWRIGCVRSNPHSEQHAPFLYSTTSSIHETSRTIRIISFIGLCISSTNLAQMNASSWVGLWPQWQCLSVCRIWWGNTVLKSTADVVSPITRKCFIETHWNSLKLSQRLLKKLPLKSFPELFVFMLINCFAAEQCILPKLRAHLSLFFP